MRNNSKAWLITVISVLNVAAFAVSATAVSVVDCEPSLGNSDYTSCNYFGANLSNANFEGTNSANVNMSSTNLDHANLAGAQIVHSEVGGFAFDYGFGINNAGKLSFGNGGMVTESAQGEITVGGESVVNDNVWHHTCVTRNNSTGEVILYVDGVQDKVGVTGTGNLVANPKAWIGKAQDGNGLFVGLIDDVRFYNSAISAADVQEAMYKPAAVEEELLPEENTEPTPTLAETGSSNNGFLALAAALLALGSLFVAVGKTRK
jgi:LPXTG-motif cell wall-anchored protein